MSRAFTVVDCIQRSPEWHRARCGNLTASRAKAIYTEGRKKGEESVMRRDLRIQIACERITGQPEDEDDSYKGRWVEQGVENEPRARLAFEARTALVVREVGFLQHMAYPIGCSPDGYLGDFEGIVSLKCTKASTQIRYCTANRLPEEYEAQMLTELWVSGAKTYHFLSWCETLPEHLRTFLTVVQRASVQTAIDDFEVRALKFLAEVDEQVAQLERLTA